MKRAWMAATLVAWLVLPVSRLPAQAVTVLYLEGTVSQRAGEAWTPVAIGDTLAADARVRLEKLALVQLKVAGSSVASITLTQPGTYGLATVLASSASLRSTGAVQAAAMAFSRVLKGSGKRVDAVGGVRSEVMPQEDFVGLLEGGPSGFESPAQEAVKTARDLIAQAEYERAISSLRDALPAASADEAREVSFYLASAYELAGDARAAMAALKAASPQGGDEWGPDAVLLGARLLEDSFAWEQARDLLLKAAAVLAPDDARAPTYFFLLALAHQGTWEMDKRAAALDRVFALDPTSELGRTAYQMRQAP